MKYFGIEAVEELAAAAQRKNLPGAVIERGDFIDDPTVLGRHAHVIVFSGSLNTLSSDEFYRALRLGWEYTQSELAFNFLCSPRLASGKHLTWHRMTDVLELAYSFTGDVDVDDSYRKGDCTIVMRK